MTRWNDAIDRMLRRIDQTARQVREGFPHWADPATGRWVTTPHGDWTGGYWVGMLWLAHALTGDRRYRARAAALVDRLRSRVDAETGFKSFVFYHAGSVGAIVAKDGAARDIAVACARAYPRLYSRRLGLVPLGAQAEEGSHTGPAETSIDSLQTAPFLFWAAREGVSEVLDMARSHAERVIALHRRPDGSFIQSSSLDPASGELRRHYTHKGYSEVSTWGRAQAWGTLFSTMGFREEPGRNAWLDAARQGAEWWMSHVPADRVAYWDFDDPAIPDTERDTAATAIMAAALVKLDLVAPEGRDRYRQFAEATVDALVSRHLTAAGVLTDACFNKRPDARPEDAANRCEFIVASYYLFETLLALRGTVDPARI